MSLVDPNLDSLRDELDTLASRDLPDASSLPPSIYWREDVAELERQNIFKRDWVCPGLAGELKEPGDYLTFSVAGEPIYCVRGRDGEIRTQ